jgi:hypothetical protein
MSSLCLVTPLQRPKADAELQTFEDHATAIPLRKKGKALAVVVADGPRLKKCLCQQSLMAFISRDQT